MIPADPAGEHRVVAARFAAVARGVPADGWAAASPVAGWTARDVVGHLVDWLPGFVAGGSDLAADAVLPPVPVDDDTAAAWERRADAVQALLDDATTAGSTFRHPRLPSMSLAEALSRFYTADVLMHTWDLARATGQDPALDEERCRDLFLGMEPLDEMLRSSGQYGPRVAVADDAAWSDRLMGFIGRDPCWRP